MNQQHPHIKNDLLLFARIGFYLKRPLRDLKCKEKRVKICLIKAGNAINSTAMNKFSNPPAGGRNFKLFDLSNRFCKGLLTLLLLTLTCTININSNNDVSIILLSPKGEEVRTSNEYYTI